MYNSNQGHGIAGAKGIYSSKVKLGNWVEDSFGELLVEQARVNDPSNYMSNTMSCYKAPDDQPEPAQVPGKMPTVAEMKIKNKEGMPYSLLFPHGLTEFPTEVSSKHLVVLSRHEFSRNIHVYAHYTCVLYTIQTMHTIHHIHFMPTIHTIHTIYTMHITIHTIYTIHITIHTLYTQVSMS